MILSGKEIVENLGKDIIIDPFSIENINPNSYNLRLSDELMIYENDVLDVAKENRTRSILIPKDGYILQPGQLYLGRSIEYTETHGLVPMLQGRSSIGRLGITVHITAGFGDVGFCGYWTMQLTCIKPIKIYSGMKICQIYYQTISGDFVEYSSEKYQNNNSVQCSQLYKEFKK